MALTQQQINDRLEYILDLVAEKIIQNNLVSPEMVQQNQKTIVNGLIELGRLLQRRKEYGQEITKEDQDWYIQLEKERFKTLSDK